MNGYKLPIEIQSLEEGGYLAICSALQGCHAEGSTVAEALDNLEDIVRTMIELRREDGLPVPDELQVEEPSFVLRGELVVTP